MKKNVFTLLLVCLMAVSLVACGTEKDQEEDSNLEQEQVQDQGAGDQLDGETEDPQQAPEDEDGETEDPISDSTAQNEPAKGPSQPVSGTSKPSSEKPAASKPQEPSKPSAGGGTSGETAEDEKQDVDLAAFYDKVAAGNENFPALMALEQETLDALYPGLSGIATNQCLAYTAMISATVGELALIEVESADDVQAVKDIFQARIDYQVGDDTNPGGACYPATIEGWKNQSAIVSNGNYVMLVVTEQKDAVIEAFNALFA